MSAGKKLGGYRKITFALTVGFTTSTEITGLWSGTQPQDSEISNQQDSLGRTLQTGIRQSTDIFTTALTAAFISTLVGHADTCTELYFKWYYTGGGFIRFGPHIVSGVGHVGAEPGQAHRILINTEGFTEDILDQIDYN